MWVLWVRLNLFGNSFQFTLAAVVTLILIIVLWCLLTSRISAIFVINKNLNSSVCSIQGIRWQNLSMFYKMVPALNFVAARLRTTPYQTKWKSGSNMFWYLTFILPSTVWYGVLHPYFDIHYCFKKLTKYYDVDFGDVQQSCIFSS